DTQVSVAINGSGSILVGRRQTYFNTSGIGGSIIDDQVVVNRYGADLNQAFEEQVLNVEHSRTSPYSSRESDPSVALDGAGRFVVTARQELYGLQLGGGEAQRAYAYVVGQAFDAAGNPLSERFEGSSTSDDP